MLSLFAKLNKAKFAIAFIVVWLISICFLNIIQYNIYGGTADVSLIDFIIFIPIFYLFDNKMRVDDNMKHLKKPKTALKIVLIVIVSLIFIYLLYIETYNISFYQIRCLLPILLFHLCFPNWSCKIKNHRIAKERLIRITVLCLVLVISPLVFSSTLNLITPDETQSMLEANQITNVEYMDSVDDKISMQIIFDGDYSEFGFYLCKGIENDIEY